MPWFHAVVERGHELQNPTSAEKVLIAASEDDWDRYEGLHWLALDE